MQIDSITETPTQERPHGPSAMRNSLAVPRSILLASFATALVVGLVTVCRHEFFMSTTFDMAFYVQDVYQIAHGGWINSVFGLHVFADHFSPLMILLAPLGLSHTAEGLLIVQALASGSGVIAAYRLGVAVRGQRIGLLCAVWWGLSVSVWHTMFYDFRPSNLGVVALLWLIAELESNGSSLAIGSFTVLAAASREDIAVFAGIAILIYVVTTRRRIILAGLGSLSVALGLWYAILGVHLFAPFDYFMWYRFADYGDSPAAVLGNLGYAIPTALERIIRPEPIVAISALLLPMLVIAPFIGWRYAWPGFLVILSNAVSADPFIPTVYFQYYVAAVIFFIWAGAHAFRLPWLAQRVPHAIMAAVLVWLVVGPVGLVLKPPGGRSFIDLVVHSDRRSMAQTIEVIPSDASISAGTYILPHLAERNQAYTYPAPMVCSPTIIAYHEFTAYPDYIVVEPRDRKDYPLDIESLGYQLADIGEGVEVWRHTKADELEPDKCPSAEDAREGMFRNVRNIAG